LDNATIKECVRRDTIVQETEQSMEKKDQKEKKEEIREIKKVCDHYRLVREGGHCNCCGKDFRPNFLDWNR
jgi:hypothetical protein